jgi:hypothetical protein
VVRWGVVRGYLKLKVITKKPASNNSAPTAATTGSSKQPPRGAYGCATMAPLCAQVVVSDVGAGEG